MSLLGERAVPGNTASLHTQGVLHPLTGGSLNATLTPPQKRKRSSSTDLYEPGRAFIIRPHPSSPFDKQLRLIPRRLLPRSNLPLSCLDIESSKNPFPNTRLFSASIAALETAASPSEQSCNPRVLIAELNDQSTLYAVERVQKDIYALCKLCDWVTVDSFVGILARDTRTQDRSCQKNVIESNEWWRTAAIGCGNGIGERQLDKRMKYDYPSIRLHLKPPQHPILFRDAPANEKPSKIAEDPVETLSSEDVSKSDSFKISPDSCPQDVLSATRVQYQEALYISKTSLAYFAKGPLSRARAVFQQEDPLRTSIGNLVEFLRSSILSLKMVDKKYREALPNIIKDIPAGIVSDDEGVQIMTLLGDKIRKSKKRKKIGKDGLSPGEEEYITRWWISRDKCADVGGPDCTSEEVIRRALVEQRARETKLQLILILEVLALEAWAASSTCQGPLGGKSKDDENVSAKKGKSHQPHDLNMLLDLLVDRLCIWQSMSSEGVTSACENDIKSFQQSKRDSSRNPGDERLRDFCIEVVVPFYAARLPDLCSSICQKLGGPTAPSPQRPLLPKLSSSSQLLPKPGEAIQRSQHRKPRRTLERVLTDERVATRRPPGGLSRSATDSMLPGLKREISEIKLSAIPMDRVTIQKSKRYSQREVDLTAASQGTEAKLQKKAIVEQELRGAIAALRKPNPRMAVKELVESAEKRAGVGVSKSRKSTNPIRNPFAQGVQVMATPKGNRLKDVFGGLPNLPVPSSGESEDPERVPPSSDPRIPSSSIRPGLMRATGRSGSAVVQTTIKPLPPRFQLTVERTPIRRQLMPSSSVLGGVENFEEHDDELSGPSPPELPVLNREKYPLKPPRPVPGRTPSYECAHLEGAVHETPTRSGLVDIITARLHQEIQDTPVKAGVTKRTEMSAGTAYQKPWSSPGAPDMGNSIYESLGWDDDDVDELM